MTKTSHRRCDLLSGSVWERTRKFSRWPQKWPNRPIGVEISLSGSVSNQPESFSDDPKSDQSVPEALRIRVRVHFRTNPKAVPMTRKVSKASQRRCEIAFGFTFASTRKPFKRPGKGLNCVGRLAQLLSAWLSPQSESSCESCRAWCKAAFKKICPNSDVRLSKKYYSQGSENLLFSNKTSRR